MLNHNAQFNEDNYRISEPHSPLALRPYIQTLNLCTWRRTSWRWIHRFSRLWMIRIRRLLQLDPGLHPAKVAIVLSITLRIGRRILRWWLIWIVRIPVKGLIRRRRTRRRSHPISANMRSETTSSTATSVEASIDFSRQYSSGSGSSGSPGRETQEDRERANIR